MDMFYLFIVPFNFLDVLRGWWKRPYVTQCYLCIPDVLALAFIKVYTNARGCLKVPLLMSIL